MSSTDGGDDGDDGPGNREVAHRLFAAEFDDVTVSYRESDEERAPNYVVTPTGARVNRLFAVGVLTEVESVNEGVVRARIADPTGVFVSYAGQYQPDALAFYERADPPSFVALTGKARTFEPEDGDRIYSSVRPESVNEVDAGTRDRWVVNAAEATIERVAVMRDALAREERGDDLRATLTAAGVRESLAAGVPLAIERYGTTPAYLDAVRRVALDALAVVAGERESVRPLDVAPDEGGAATVGPLPDIEDRTDGIPADAGTEADEDGTATEATDATAGTTEPTVETVEAEGAGTSTESTTEAESAADAGAESETEPTADAGTEPTADAGTEPESETEPEVDTAAEPAGTETEAETGSTADAGASPAKATTEEPTDGVAEAGENGEPADGDELGDFEPDEGADVDTDEVYEMDEAERREVEEEYGTEFATGTEVDEPGEADIDVPEADAVEPESDGEAPAEATSAESADATDEAAAEEPADASEEAESESEAVDLEEAAVAAMENLDEGDGADHEAVVAAVVDEHGADPGAVEDAIQDALMSGRCYEPDEATLKPI